MYQDTSRLFFRFFLFLIFISSIHPLFANELKELQESLQRQDNRIKRMQVLLAEQNARQDGIEQSQPPLDLIESLYEDLNRMQEEIQNLRLRLLGVEEQMKKEWSEHQDKQKDSLKYGMLALLAGDSEAAAEWFNLFLINDSKPQLRNDLLMALAHSYLEKGFAEQAASYYGTVLGQLDRSRHYLLALYSLGRAFEMLGEKTKRDVVWGELVEKFPNHPLTFQVQLSQKTVLNDPIRKVSSDNQSAVEIIKESEILEN